MHQNFSQRLKDNNSSRILSSSLYRCENENHLLDDTATGDTSKLPNFRKNIKYKLNRVAIEKLDAYFENVFEE